MKRYQIIVRNFYYDSSHDPFLNALGWIYTSPIINKDIHSDNYEFIEKFDKEYRQFYRDFQYPTFKLIDLENFSY